VWGESGIMTGVYLRWYSSLFALVLVGLCDRLCLLLVCKGRYGFFGGVSSPDSGIRVEFSQSRTGGVSWGVWYVPSYRYMETGSDFLFLQEQLTSLSSFHGSA
jgi:hypothetical protein